MGQASRRRSEALVNSEECGGLDVARRVERAQRKVDKKEGEERRTKKKKKTICRKLWRGS